MSLLTFLDVKGVFTSYLGEKQQENKPIILITMSWFFIIYNSNTSVIYVNILNIYVDQKKKKKRRIVALTPLPVTIYVT